jgi:hypothetical protein
MVLGRRGTLDTAVTNVIEEVPHMRSYQRGLLFIALLAAVPAPALAAEAGSGEGESKGEDQGDSGDLAKATQNPVADLISVPFQNNTTYNIGPNERASNTLNIQPVIPVHLGEHVLMISRTIAPIVYQPDLTGTSGGSSAFGDINPTFFFSPAKQGKIIWGVGPALVLPTATQRTVGTGKWSAGPAAVALVQPGKWTIGALASQVWSFAGPDDRADVSVMTLQYFVNYNLPDAWYLSSSPILSFNWNAPSSEKWVVPVGGGIGKIFKLGKLPLNGTLQTFYNFRPEDSQAIGRWSVRVQIALLFPTKKPAKKPSEEQEGSASAKLARPSAVTAQNPSPR